MDGKECKERIEQVRQLCVIWPTLIRKNPF